jgi:predicted SAM-dependent methyltransferase
MGKGAPLRWIENQVLARRLRGRGLEIGALWRKFPVPARATVWYLDRHDSRELQRHYPEVGAGLVLPDIIADAARLPLAAASLHFIIASHVLEHLPFPLAALREWYRVLRSGGVLSLKIPDKRYTFDAGRPRTPLQHLIGEDLHSETFDKRAHFQDWVEHVGKRAPGSDALFDETNQLLERDYSIHYHVWTDQDIRELLDYTRTGMGLQWRPILFWRAHLYRKECCVVLRRD